MGSIDRGAAYRALGVSDKVLSFTDSVLQEIEPAFARIDAIAEFNQARVIGAMQRNNVNVTHFNPSTGYGNDDEGRETLERVYADCFHAESALVRPQITCGTHALYLALSANLLPGDELLSPVGAPYDTMEEVIGIRPSPLSLMEYGVSYRQVELTEDGGFDYDGIRAAINEKTKLVTIQRSKGYATRPSLSVEQVGKLIAFCKQCKPDVICMVDNCYGEFTETRDPTDVGADMIVGSLIKNPGGGLAVTGGYVCGRKDLIDRCAYRLSAPGMGREVGANMGLLPSFYQGLFLAPTVVQSAVKGAVFAAGCYQRLGFRVVPTWDTPRCDIIQAVELGSREAMIAFCKGIQAAAPVDSYVTPVPSPMAGYESEIIMAAGAFNQGSSIELSADGPIRPPYAVYYQGGLTWYHAKLGVMMSLQKMQEAGLIAL
ncbi:MAG: methionine gamma-lyase family protein [Oscillospiraceae bacterium]|nr:methionine gamma-lyase family protein [Oscillospiraceae bacterium]